MKFTPKEIKGNVNITHKSPLKELCLLLGGLIGIIVAVYIVLGFAVDFAVSKLPPDAEKLLGSMYGDPFEKREVTPAETRLKKILDDLVDVSSMAGRPFEIHIVPYSKPNAFAFPGGRIVVLSALIREVESENELAFILAHELGHFANRDHLRGLGRGLVLTTMSVLLLGDDNALSNILMKSLVSVEMKFSQSQENQADLYGLDLVNKRYGHISGATDFFEKILEDDKRGRLVYFFSTHPYPKDRVVSLQKKALEKGYAKGEKTPLADILKSIPESGEDKKLDFFGRSQYRGN